MRSVRVPTTNIHPNDPIFDWAELDHHPSRPPGGTGTSLSYHSGLAVSHPQGLQGNSKPVKADQREEFSDSPQVLWDKQPYRTWSRVHHSSDSDLAFPQVRNSRHV